MAQAVAQHISPKKLAKLSALDTLDAYNARMKYATTALRFADACDVMGNDELTSDLPIEVLADPETRMLCLRSLAEVDQLVKHLFDLANASKSGEAR